MRLDFSVEDQEVVYQSYELKGWYGKLSSLAIKDNGIDGSDVYLGMGIDPFYSTSDKCEWSPAIYLVDKDFNYKNVWRLRLGPQYSPSSEICTEGNNPDYAMPDNLLIEDDYIFGSTMNSNRLTARLNNYVWRAKVTDGILSETPGDLIALQLDPYYDRSVTIGLKRDHTDDFLVHGILF